MHMVEYKGLRSISATHKRVVRRRRPAGTEENVMD